MHHGFIYIFVSNVMKIHEMQLVPESVLYLQSSSSVSPHNWWWLVTGPRGPSVASL